MVSRFAASPWGAFLAELPFKAASAACCHIVAVMRGGYINEKQNFSEENSRYAAERILRYSLG